MYIAMSMTRGWPVYEKRTARESGLFMEKSTVYRECLLYIKFDAVNRQFRDADKRNLQ